MLIRRNFVCTISPLYDFSLLVTLCTTCINNKLFCILPTEHIYGFRMVLRINNDYFPKQHKPLKFIMKKYWDFFEVGAECWDTNCISFGFKALTTDTTLILGVDPSQTLYLQRTAQHIKTLDIHPSMPRTQNPTFVLSKSTHLYRD
jgi:hypothetical protein